MRKGAFYNGFAGCVPAKFKNIENPKFGFTQLGSPQA